MTTNTSISNKSLTSKRTIMVQTSSVFLVIEVLAIEDHKLNSTFLHVAFGS
jgi:hypothetical protein